MKLKRWQKPPRPLTEGDNIFMDYLMAGIRERHARAISRQGATTENVLQTTTEAGTGKGEYNERNTSER